MTEVWLLMLGICLPLCSAFYDYDSNYGNELGYDRSYTDSSDLSNFDWEQLGELLQTAVGGSSSDNLRGYSMKDAERMLSYGYSQQQNQPHQQQQNSYGFQQQQPSAYGYGMTSQNVYGMQQQQQQQQGYGQQQNNGYSQMQQGSGQQQSGYGMRQSSMGYGMMQNSGYGNQQSGYGQQMSGGYGQRRKKKEKVYVPIVIQKKRQKKRKTLAVYKGFYIPGGTQVFGKFKKMSDCKKACEFTPTCFAADYNPSLKKCYVHTNITACDNMRTHPKLIHFKKVPCDLLETPRGLITLGTQIFGGLEQKGVKNLQDCIKKCATAGRGIADTQANIAQQTCFGIDYDFSTHRCYFHTDATLCPAQAVIPTPSRLVASPSTINILLCPLVN